jgi:predicted SAM-dependent methyltransferase
VVLSAGFVEHFDKPELVFEKHCDLLQNGGFLIIVLPNLRYMQKILRISFWCKT